MTLTPSPPPPPTLTVPLLLVYFVVYNLPSRSDQGPHRRHEARDKENSSEGMRRQTVTMHTVMALDGWMDGWIDSSTFVTRFSGYLFAVSCAACCRALMTRVLFRLLRCAVFGYRIY